MDQQSAAAVRAKLYSRVISDALDSLGNMRHAMLPNIRPLDDVSILFGRARTGLYAPLYHVGGSQNPCAIEMALVEDLKSDDVVILACPACDRICTWGRLYQAWRALATITPRGKVTRMTEKAPDAWSSG